MVSAIHADWREILHFCRTSDNVKPRSRDVVLTGMPLPIASRRIELYERFRRLRSFIFCIGTERELEIANASLRPINGILMPDLIWWLMI